LKKLLSVFLTIVMLIGILPYQISAATELSWNDGTITLASGTAVGSYTLNTLSIYKQGASSTFPAITEVTQDGNTINITLAEGTDYSYPLQMGFAGTGGYVQHVGNTCTLKNGKGTATVTISAKPAPAPNAPVWGTDTFTINFSVEAGETYEVTPPVGEGFTFDGETIAGKNQNYSFTVTVNEGYDGSKMIVKANGTELIGNNGSYIITAVSEDIIITVEGIEKKAIYTVTLTEGSGYIITGQATSYAGEPYTFTVNVNDDIYWADKIEVRIDGEPVTLTNSKYTIEALDSDKIITIDNILEREIFTVTKPQTEGVVISGDSEVRDGKPYTFAVTVDEKYDATNIKVVVNGSEVELADSQYTIASVNGNVTIEVSGIVKKPICEIIKPAEGKFTFTGDDFAYKGNDYVFTVTPHPGYLAAVTVNGEAVEGSNNTYTVRAENDEIVIAVTLQRTELPETELEITAENDIYTIDVTDNKLNVISSYHATVTDIKISGAQVVSAFESGTTIYFNLHSNTPDTAEITAEFLYTNKNCSLNGNILSILLEDGEAGKKHTVTANYSGIKTKSAEYTLIFFREIPSEEPPVCIKKADTNLKCICLSFKIYS